MISFGSVQWLRIAFRGEDGGGSWFFFEPLWKSGREVSYKLYCYVTVIKQFDQQDCVQQNIEEIKCFSLQICVHFLTGFFPVFGCLVETLRLGFQQSTILKFNTSKSLKRVTLIFRKKQTEKVSICIRNYPKVSWKINAEKVQANRTK